MKIRDRLSLQFTLMFAVILFLVLASIFISVEKSRKINFYNRLVDRAFTVAQLFLAEDNLSKEKFEEVQRRYPLSLPQESVHIYNYKFEPVFLNQNTNQWSNNIIEKVIKEKKIQFEDNEKQSVGIFYEDNSGNFVVLISAYDQDGVNRRKQLFWSMTFTFIISIIIMFFMGRLFAWTALLPITKAIKEVKFIRSSNLDRRLQTKQSKDEINELISTFNNLLEHMEQSFNAQRSFVTYASHELRTPITSIIGQIEVTLAFERSKEDYQQTLKSVLAVTEKFNDLINDLFELAQTTIDVNDFEDVRLDELIWQVKDEWMNKVPGCQIELTYDLDTNPEKYTIRGKGYLLFIAIGNIIKNAIKFSENKPIVCTIKSTPKATLISIKDSGIGVAPEDLNSIFDPFKRGANAAGFAGFGIGLSLTKKILLLHDAKVRVNPEYMNGTEFIISFPST